MSGASTSSPPQVVMTSRWIPEKGEAGQLFASAAYWVTSDWSLGVDIRPLIDSIEINSNYRLFSEVPGTWKPGIIIGTSQDDFSKGDIEVESRAWFGTVSKALPRIDALNITVSPYAGAVWIHELDDLRPLAGVNINHSLASLMVQYSGTNTHVTVSKSINSSVSFSAIYWGLKYPGVGMRFKF